jgi:hypothetical protein
VVTAMHVRLHPLTEILAGFLMFPFHQAAQVLTGLQNLDCPDELTVQTGILSGPDGTPVILLGPAWAGEPAAGQEWIARLESLGTPLLSQVAPMPYAQLLGHFDAQMHAGDHYAIRTRTVRRYEPELIAALIEAGRTRTSPLSGIPIHHFHGAATRVPGDATAFPDREAHHVIEIVAGWRPDDPAPERHIAWADSVSQALAPMSDPGGYINLLGPEAHDQIDLAYGSNTARLLAIKNRYDPNGVFTATGLPRSAEALR